MSISNKNKHLTAEERSIILQGILRGASKVSIASVLGKDKSTIGKEIKLHRVHSYKCTLALECSVYKTCKHGRHCSLECIDYTPFKCSRRDRSPGVCNGCDKTKSCRFNKFQYQPDLAYKEYRSLLTETRSGINATRKEIKALGELVMPLLKQGQSIYHILKNNPSIQLSEKTLYTYIDDGVFKDVGVDISNMDLRRKVGRKMPKKNARGYKKRNDFSYLKNRKHEDYLRYIEEHPDASVVEMDTVYNDGSDGPFIQTFKFMKYGFLFALLHEHKTMECMNDGVATLEKIIGKELFTKTVEVLLTDRGSEFYDPETMETSSDGTRRTYVFYCDSMASHQKGSIENNHIELRYILPKGTDLKELGLQSQNDLNKALSHINSFSKEKLHGKSAHDLLVFLNPKLANKFIIFGIKKIAAKDVVLKPFLLKH